MYFRPKDLSDMAWEEDDILLTFVEASEWTQDNKYQTREIIFMYRDKFYRYYQSRSGSPFTDWYYDDEEYPPEWIKCDEVQKTTKTITVWEIC